VTAPRIAILGGERVNPNQFGQVWYYFEQDLGYPVSVFYPDNISSIASGDYDILILPDGRYNLSGSEKALTEWVRSGGKLIAIGNANGSLGRLESFSLAGKESAKEEKDADAPDDRLLPYGGSERRFISNFNPGAIVGVEMDKTYPLSFGIGEKYYSLKTGAGRNAGIRR